MPLPLLIPAAIAASSPISLTTLILSITASVTGGALLGATAMSSSDTAASETRSAGDSWTSFVEEIRSFPQKTVDMIADTFRDYKEVSTQMASHTRHITKVSAALGERARDTSRHIKSLTDEVHGPLAAVGDTLKTTNSHAKRIHGALTATEEQLKRANEELIRLKKVLTEQQNQIAQLNTLLIPLNDRLTSERKEKERLNQRIAQLTKAHKTDMESLKNLLEQQESLTKELTRRLETLEQEKKELIEQKETLTQLLSSYTTQIDNLVKQCAAFEMEIESLQKQYLELKEKGDKGAEVVATSLQMKALEEERNRLQEELKRYADRFIAVNKILDGFKEQSAHQEAVIAELKKEHAELGVQYEQVSALVQQLNEEAKEQEALIEEQALMVQRLSRSPTSGLLSSGLFAPLHATTPTPDTPPVPRAPR